MNLFNYLFFLGRGLIKRGLPLQLVYFVTGECNLRCKHCFYVTNHNKRKKEELSLDEIKKIFSKREKFLWISLTGGEPFLRDDLVQIAEIICNNKINNLSIPTNGQLPQKIFLATLKILKRCPQTYVTITLSLDGFPQTHNLIRGTRSAFQNVICTFEKLKCLKNKFKNFGLSIQTTLSSLNQRDILSFYKFVRDKLKPDILTFNLVRAKENEIESISPQKYLETTKLLEEDCKRKKFSYYKFPLSKFALIRNFITYEEISKLLNTKCIFLPVMQEN